MADSLNVLNDALSTGGIVRMLAIAIYIVDVIIAFVIVFLERREATSTLAWLVILFAVPIVGILLYFFFSQHIARRKIFDLTENDKEIMSHLIARQTSKMDRGELKIEDNSARRWQELIRLNQSYGHALLNQGNSATIITEGKDLLMSMFEDMDRAKKSIDVMFFIVKNDVVGKLLIEELTERAKDGIEVHFLVDALGSRRISGKAVREFKAAGGHFETFFPPMIKWLAFNFNYRNHRKMTIIDDEIGYIGGQNIAKEYLDMSERFRHWRDTHIRFEGEAVRALKARFEIDWRTTMRQKKDMDINKYLSSRNEEKQGDIAMQIVSSGPDTKREEVKYAFLKMISEANKNIYIQTPYFVPDAAILESLKVAAQSGVDVRIMIPCMPDHIFVYWITYSFVGQLIQYGVKVYIYDDGFLHAKTVTVDGEVSTVGSTNFDRRSFRYNFETNAFLYNEVFTKELEHTFKEDMKKSHQLTAELYENRGTWIKIKESLCRLVTDLV